MRSLASFALLCLATSAAHAEDDVPGGVGGFEAAIGYGHGFESLRFRQRVEGGMFVRIGPWQVTAGMSFGTIDSTNAPRDSSHVTNIALGGRIAYRAEVGSGLVGSVGLGLEHHWLSGTATVARTCAQTHTCIAGFYSETPSYRGWVPSLRVSLGIDNRSGSSIRSIALEVSVARYDLADVPPDGLRGYALLGGLSGEFGRGWDWHRP